MVIQFAGVRGSLPSPGPGTIRYGGNTTCVTVELDDVVLILDAGSGIREVGNRLLNDPRDIILLLTHVHWDHIQGLPFFKPVYLPDRRIKILASESEWVARVKATMDGSHYFPMKFDHLRSDIQFVTDGLDGLFEEMGLRLRSIRTNHPGICYGFRVEHGDRAFAFIPDNELAASRPVTGFGEFVDFVGGVDLLIHDCQYTDSDMPAKLDWGHSTPADVTRLAREARVKQLQLFHHDPERNDDAVTSIESQAKRMLRGSGISCRAAVEGARMVLG